MKNPEGTVMEPGSGTHEQEAGVWASSSVKRARCSRVEGKWETQVGCELTGLSALSRAPERIKLG